MRRQNFHKIFNQRPAQVSEAAYGGKMQRKVATLVCKQTISDKGGGCIAQWLAVVLPDLAAPGSNPSIPENFLRKQF